ncbi:MAG: UDP-N-acetylmuramate--L-alanine ligase [Bacillota bacterium]
MLRDTGSVHFIAIGGIGMSALAKILIQMGYQVSGSDIAENNITDTLRSLGARVEIGHRAENIGNPDLVVVSSAIRKENPELGAARDRGIPVWHRADLLAYLMGKQESIAVTGAHGKTTTSSMLTLVLLKNKFDPTAVIGGELEQLGGNGALGHGRYLVAEVDESDGTFLRLRPTMAITTNIEADHLDHYHTLQNIIDAFAQFLGHVPPSGLAVLGIDDRNVRDIIPRVQCPKLTYGLDYPADLTASDINLTPFGSRFTVIYHGQPVGSIELKVPGRHNIQNALAVIGISLHLGLSLPEIACALIEFRGAKRRFQLLGEVQGIRVVDDYAHHPTEIKAALAAAQTTNAKRVVAVFQPHLYSRTSFLQDAFGQSFGDADLVVITDVYGSRELPQEGVTGQLIVDALHRHDSRSVVYVQDKRDIPRRLVEIARPGDLIMTIGAGDIWKYGLETLELLQNGEAQKSADCRHEIRS